MNQDNEKEIKSIYELKWYNEIIPAGTIARVIDEDFIEFEYPDGKKNLLATQDYNLDRSWGEDYGVVHVCRSSEIINFIKSGNYYNQPSVIQEMELQKKEQREFFTNLKNQSKT